MYARPLGAPWLLVEIGALHRRRILARAVKFFHRHGIRQIHRVLSDNATTPTAA